MPRGAGGIWQSVCGSQNESEDAELWTLVGKKDRGWRCVCAYAREVEGSKRVVVHGFDALALEDLYRHGRLEGRGWGGLSA